MARRNKNKARHVLIPQRGKCQPVIIHDLESGRILVADDNDVYAIQCFRNGKRKLTDDLNRTEALAFRNAALHLTKYLAKHYDLPNPLGRPANATTVRSVRTVEDEG